MKKKRKKKVEQRENGEKQIYEFLGDKQPLV
jgi:hypothetical protein